MSDADELLKYKKLLDDGIIAQAEFDIKKNELTGGTQATQSPGLNAGSIFLIGVCVLILSMMILPLMGWNIFGNSSTPEELSEKAKAEYYATEEIKKVLNSPSSAVILDNPVIIELSAHTYSVTGDLDAENAFGTKLRKRWTCKMSFSDSDSYTADCAVVE